MQIFGALKRLAQRNIRAFEQRRRSGTGPEQLPGLQCQIRIGQRKRRELIVQELIIDLLGEFDGIDGHSNYK